MEDTTVSASALVSTDLARALEESDELMAWFKQRLADELFRKVSAEMEAKMVHGVDGVHIRVD